MPMQATTTAPLFSAELTPHRSLGHRGLTAIASLCALLAVLPGLGLLAIGFWPIAAAMAAIALAIGAVLVLSLRQGKRREEIVVWADQLEWTATDASGAKSLRRFNPKSVRLVLERDEDEKTLALSLRVGKDELELGTFLHPDDKSSFAKALGTALRKARAA